MVEKISFRTQGTCCQIINLEIEDNIIKNVEFLGGCHGNLQGIGRLVVGMSAEDVIQKLKGILCNSKPTSCPDQLARCLEQYLNSKTAQQSATV